MSNLFEYKDIVAFHPGYYIAEMIEDMGISQAEFATRLGTTGKTLSQLVNGQINLSNDIAKKLAAMLGTGVAVWLNLQAAYDQKIIEIEYEKDLDEQAQIARLIDYSYFINTVGLPREKDIRKKVSNLCKYLMISDLRILSEPDFLVNFRTSISAVDSKNVINSRAWIQTAMNVSKEIETKPFNPEKLKAYLPELRSMTSMSPDDFLPRMSIIFAECGVAFVLLPHLKNSGVNGAVKWISSERVVLAMNNRGLDADKFWFSLFHEIKHVFQQKVKTTFVNYSEAALKAIDSKLEEEADTFAKNYLIPPAQWKTFSPNKYTTDEEIAAFAESIGIHPGIVAGRMQHDGLIAQNRCNNLKEKYTVEMLTCM